RGACQMETWREWRVHGGSVILPKRASSPSTKAGGVPAAPWRSSWSAPHPNPLPESAGLSGESKAVARSRSCATREDPRGRTWSDLVRPPTSSKVALPGGWEDDRGREGFGPPLPPNRACGFPAHGSPVVGFLIGSVSRDNGLWLR